MEEPDLSKVKVRADALLAKLHPEYSRAALAKLFAQGLVKVNQGVIKAGEKLAGDVKIEADLSSLSDRALDIELPILYQDDNCIVIDKPAGVLTHAMGKHGSEASVASFLRDKVVGLDGDRAGIVHRLDRATSGVIIGAKNQVTLSYLQKQFSLRKVKKIYIAVVKGCPDSAQALVDMPIERNPKAPSTFRVGPNGKPSQTKYTVVRSGDFTSLVELEPKTGRTHQLRVHMAKIGHPIVGDPLYGGASFGDRLFLHARSLEITLPGGERKVFESELPSEFEKAII